MQGSCLCGSVAYDADVLTGPIVHCHCITCQKAHSAVFASTARVERSGFRWTRGDEARRAFESTPGKLRHFCAQCGTHLMAEWVGRDYVILRVASLDDDPGVQPAARIWTAYDRPWLQWHADVPAYDEGAPPAK